MNFVDEECPCAKCRQKAPAAMGSGESSLLATSDHINYAEAGCPCAKCRGVALNCPAPYQTSEASSMAVNQTLGADGSQKVNTAPFK